MHIAVCQGPMHANLADLQSIKSMHLKLERLQNNEILVEDGTGVGRFRIGYITLGSPDCIFQPSPYLLAPHLGLIFYTLFGR